MLRRHTFGLTTVLLPLLSLLITGLVPAVTAVAGQTASITPPIFVRKWGSPLPSAPGEMSFPSGVAIGSSGNVYVADSSNDRVQEFDSNGVFLLQWGQAGTGDGEFQSPTSVAVDGFGSVYVADSRNQRIEKFTPSGSFLTKWGPAFPGGHLGSELAVATDAVGNVFVSDRDSAQIVKFDSNGDFLLSWGNFGNGDGQFENALGIAVSPSGTVYVTDDFTNRVQSFTPNGTLINKWGSLGSGDGMFSAPVAIAVDSFLNVYVADSLGFVQKFTSNGAFISRFGGPGLGDGELYAASAAAVDAFGSLYIADLGNQRIQKFTLAGTFVTKWGSSLTAAGQLNSPEGVALDSSGNVYVADSGNNRIQKFTSSGAFITMWGTQGSGDGQFVGPFGVAVDSSGDVFVVDVGNRRIEKFTSNGIFLAQWNSLGPSGENFLFPIAVAVDAMDNVYVGDLNQVDKFASDGTFISSLPSNLRIFHFNLATGVGVAASGNVYVADSRLGIVKLDPKGDPLAMWRGSAPEFVAVDSMENVYSIDVFNFVHEFSSGGTPIVSWGAIGSGDGQFESSGGLAINSFGDVYITDAATRRIQQFSFLSATMKDAQADTIRFSPQTGGYVFTHGALTVSGIGGILIKGGVVRVTDSQPDRRIAITYHPNQLSGKAVVSVMVAPGVWQTFVLRS